MQKYRDEGSDTIRLCIGQAVIDLMSEKNFEEINVTNICRAAHVGRTTFYRYFGTKNGKRDALYSWLKIGWINTGKSDLPVPEIDREFMTYMYSVKDALLLLHSNGFDALIDELIFETYAGDCTNENRYFKYAGAGIWIGVVRAILDSGFADDMETVQKYFLSSLLQMINVK
ncbi:MAG: TetR/AcrR family transcriptional regulator [Candidatus Coproplasma sp.]